MRRTFPRRWVSPRAGGGAKVTQTPENGRPHGTKERNRAGPACRLAFHFLCWLSKAYFWVCSGLAPPRLSRAATGAMTGLARAELWRVGLLQVEERDSGTESDDEADRTDYGECTTHTHSHSRYWRHSHHTVALQLWPCSADELSRFLAGRSRVSHFHHNNTEFYDKPCTNRERDYLTPIWWKQSLHALCICMLMVYY